MRIPLLGLGAALFTLLLLCPAASGHGGRYRGPVGEVPPGQADPKDPQPPPEGGNGESPPVRGPHPPRGPGGWHGPRPMDFTSWLFWWHLNKDEILTRRVARRRRACPGLSRAVSQEMIDRVILSALRRVEANRDMHPDIRAGALIAEARAGDRPGLCERLFAHARPESGEERIVRESAILGLALAGNRSEAVRDFLIGIADDREDQWRVRCFAMVALGLLRDASQEVFDCLLRRLDGEERIQDVPAAALYAMGLAGDRARVPEMAAWLEAGRVGAGKLSDLERATLVGALGRIGDPMALDAISRRFEVKGLLSRRAAAIALGRLVPGLSEADQAAWVAKIAGLVGSETDDRTRNLLVTALGRIGATPGAPAEARDECVEFLSGVAPLRKHPYHALALGLIGFGEGGQGTPGARLGMAKAVMGALEKIRGDKVELAAQAIALGLLGDGRKETVGLLLEILRDRGQERKLRGAAAVALGMIGSPDTVEPLIRALGDRENRDMRVDLALAAGLTGDPRFVEPLFTVMRDPKASQFVLGSVALALGWIGDRSAVRPLLLILEPGRPNGWYPDLTRALAAVALGRLAMRGDTDPIDRLSRDLNLSASTEFLEELLSIL